MNTTSTGISRSRGRGLPRAYDDNGGWPAVADVVGQSKPIHGAWHLNIGEDHSDLGICLKDAYGFGCDDPGGFGVRVKKKTGTKAYVLQYPDKHNITKRITLAKCNVLTLKQARDLARVKLAQNVIGLDLTADKKKNHAITVRAFCDTYLEKIEAGALLTKKGTPKKPKTIATDRGRIERHIKPLIGHYPLSALTYSIVETMHEKILKKEAVPGDRNNSTRRNLVKGGPGAASKTVKLLSAICESDLERRLYRRARSAFAGALRRHGRVHTLRHAHFRQRAAELPSARWPAFQTQVEIERVMGTVGVGIDFVWSDASTVKLHYDGMFGEDTQQHAFGAKASFKF